MVLEEPVGVGEDVVHHVLPVQLGVGQLGGAGLEQEKGKLVVEVALRIIIPSCNRKSFSNPVV